MPYILSVIMTCLLLCPPVFAAQSLEKTPLRTTAVWLPSDPDLQKKLEQVCRQLGLEQHIKKGRLALAVVDLSEENKPRLAELNGNKMYYAASLPKIAILLGAFVEIQAGNLQESEDLYQQMTAMIRYSSNEAANHVLALAGEERILEILQDPGLALYDPQLNGGLWIGKAYGKTGAYRRDPLYNLSHGATAIQAARFYYLLETDQLLRHEYSEKMKEILSKPGISHKFVAGLSKIPEIEIYRKSGTWKNYHADSAMVEYKGFTYIIIGLAESQHGGQWLEKLALPLHEMITGDKS